MFIKKFINFFDGKLKTFGSFESQIAAICDDIAYNNNDIDDGLYANFFGIEELEQLSLVKQAIKTIKIKRNNIDRLKYEIVRKLIKIMLDDLIKNTRDNIKRYKVLSSNDIISLDKCVVCFSKNMKDNELLLKKISKNKDVYASKNKNYDI